MLPVFTELADCGHNVTVVSSFKSEAHKTVQDVTPFEDFDYFPNLSAMELRQAGPLGMVFLDQHFLLQYCDSAYGLEEFMSLLNETFDLVLIDAAYNECLLGFVHKLGAPLIIMNPFPVHNVMSVHFGNRFVLSFFFLTYSSHFQMR